MSSGLAFEAASYPPFGAGFHAYPPEKAFEHFECSGDAEMAGGLGMACVHDPWSGQEWHIDADGVIKGGAASAARAIGRELGGKLLSDE